MTMDIAEMIASRLCHDLASPLGAIGNGLELLRMTQSASEEMALLDQAVAAAQARVHLFRLAFGAADAGQIITTAEMQRALAALATNRPIVVTVQTPPLPRPQARALALAALCAETALAWGGALSVQADRVEAQAPRLRLDPALWGALTGAGAVETSAASVQFTLLARLSPRQVQTTDTTLTIGF